MAVSMWLRALQAAFWWTVVSVVGTGLTAAFVILALSWSGGSSADAETMARELGFAAIEEMRLSPDTVDGTQPRVDVRSFDGLRVIYSDTGIAPQTVVVEAGQEYTVERYVLETEGCCWRHLVVVTSWDGDSSGSIRLDTGVPVLPGPETVETADAS